MERPQPLPAQALDHATGYLAAFGAMLALARRAREGGSYLVRVSLAQTGRWIDGLGRADGQRVPDPTVDDVGEYLQTTEALFGVLRHVAPAAKLSETPARCARPPVPLGTHTPGW
jgi:crotonobetainyl-CoA:carnitine CoA-transferase CaiB-like acyl-CoA transferase